MRVSDAIERIEVTFDDSNLVANSRLLLVPIVAHRLGLEGLVDATVRLLVRAALPAWAARS